MIVGNDKKDVTDDAVNSVLDHFMLGKKIYRQWI